MEIIDGPRLWRRDANGGDGPRLELAGGRLGSRDHVSTLQRRKLVGRKLRFVAEDPAHVHRQFGSALGAAVVTASCSGKDGDSDQQRELGDLRTAAARRT